MEVGSVDGEVVDVCSIIDGEVVEVCGCLAAAAGARLTIRSAAPQRNSIGCLIGCWRSTLRTDNADQIGFFDRPEKSVDVVCAEGGPVGGEGYGVGRGTKKHGGGRSAHV